MYLWFAEIKSIGCHAMQVKLPAWINGMCCIVHWCWQHMVFAAVSAANCCRFSCTCSLAMIRSLRRSPRILRLTSLSVFLISAAVIILLYRAVIFTPVDNVGRTLPSLIGHRRHAVVRHNTNCPAGSIYCSDNGNGGLKLFRSLKLVMWSTDHHPAPAYDARFLIEPLGVKFLQHDLSPYCIFFNLCEERNSLKVNCSFVPTLLLL